MTVKARILVVDDEERFRQSLCRLLRAEGFTAEPAESGLDALNKLATGEFDVVLLDMKMHGMSGAETFNEIQLQGFDVGNDLPDRAHLHQRRHEAAAQRGLRLSSQARVPCRKYSRTVQRAMERKLLRHGRIGMTELIEGSGPK